MTTASLDRTSTCAWLPVAEADRLVAEGMATPAPSVYFPLLHDLRRIAFATRGDWIVATGGGK